MELLTDQIKDDMKASMKAKNKVRLGTIRMILAAIKQIEVDERIEVDNPRVMRILDKMLKQRRESMKQFRDANRNDLAAIEAAEILVIQDFLPQALSAEEIDGLIKAAIADTSAVSMKAMGQVMAILKPKLQGRADMSHVSQKIKLALAS
jgi:uncharacterized protein YqeY